MRKFVLTAGLLIGFYGACFAGSRDIFSTDRPALWRSSRTATADNFVLIATGAIHFHGIVIGSPTVNVADSRISLFNSTTTNTSLYNFSTATLIDLGTRFYTLSSNNAGASSPTVVIPALTGVLSEYDMFFSSGLVYDKRGLSDITILWDYVFPYAPSDKSQLVPFKP